MNRKQLAIVFGVLTVVVIGVVLLLVTGGDDTPGPISEGTGDVKEIEGVDAPSDIAVADIEFAEVRREGNSLVFEARLGAQIPKKIKDGSFDLRWDINVNNAGAFIVAGNLDVGENASIVGLVNNFGASTLDESFPGEMEINGNIWIITITPEDIPDWPEDFQWRLTTTLDGKAGDPKSGLAEDSVPDLGFGEVTE